MSNKIPIVKKLSIKTILGRKPKAPAEGKIDWLCQIIGVATGVKTGNSNFGDWTALMGSFQGLNMETGDISRSGQCFLPDVALNLITAALLNKDARGIEFAFNIGVKEDSKSTTGYVYVCEPVLEASENDPLEMLTKKLPGKEKVAQLEKKKA
jgi:hypothetical protein